MNTCPIDKVRVVVLGQDPYHGPGQAMGMSFSVAPGVPVPSSLRNIFKELRDDVGCVPPGNGDLSKVTCLWSTWLVGGQGRDAPFLAGHMKLEVEHSTLPTIEELPWGKDEPPIRGLSNACHPRLQASRFSDPWLKSCVQWAERGVLLLNAVLTVRSGAAASHQKKGWERFTDAVIRTLNRERTGVVYLLWGRHAQVGGLERVLMQTRRGGSG